MKLKQHPSRSRSAGLPARSSPKPIVPPELYERFLQSTGSPPRPPTSSPSASSASPSLLSLFAPVKPPEMDELQIAAPHTVSPVGRVPSRGAPSIFQQPAAIPLALLLLTIPLLASAQSPTNSPEKILAAG